MPWLLLGAVVLAVAAYKRHHASLPPFRVGDKVMKKDGAATGKVGTVTNVEYVPSSVQGPYFRVTVAFDSSSGAEGPASDFVRV